MVANFMSTSALVQKAYHSSAAQVYNLIFQLHSLLLQQVKVCLDTTCDWLIKQM